jgi:hypothetical protein
MPAPDITTINILKTKPQVFHGLLNRKRILTVECNAGTVNKLQHQITDTEGNVVDLSTDPTVIPVLKAAEITILNPNKNPANIIEISGTVINPTEGLVEFNLGKEISECPGILRTEIGLQKGQDILYIHPLYIVANKSLWQPSESDSKCGDSLSIAELRLYIHESNPNENLWLEMEEFDPTELAMCIELPVRAFNELPPPLPVSYNTTNFPYKYNWLIGATAQLYRVKAKHYLRTHLPYQTAGGAAVDDKNKFQVYEQIGLTMWQEYLAWVRMKKVELNIEGGFRGLPSGYTRRF